MLKFVILSTLKPIDGKKVEVIGAHVQLFFSGCNGGGQELAL